MGLLMLMCVGDVVFVVVGVVGEVCWCGAGVGLGCGAGVGLVAG